MGLLISSNIINLKQDCAEKMFPLQGNLGDRHRALNSKVNEAVAKNVDFEEIRDGNEKTDVDRLFKIDVASKYKNFDFIVETLKSGDDLYVSKALKSIWVYDDEFAHVINPVYLQSHIFPSMSLKMQKKFLTRISIHVKNENRAAEFYSYTSLKFTNIAFKFLLNCTEVFKIDIIKKDVNVIRQKGEMYLKNFIGNSFLLAESYLRAVNEYFRCQELTKLKYFYAISPVRYLDLFDKYASYNTYALTRFGLRMSKDIMINHKDRVLKNPFLYLEFINTKMLVKYSTREDAKNYLTTLLPEDSHFFYEHNFYKCYEDVISIIPTDERFRFVKRLYIETYGEEFETSDEFFYYGYHKLLSKSELEEWALSHIASRRNIGGYDEYYWYRYVSFDKLFNDMRDILEDINCSERTYLLSSLVNRASNQRELENVLNLYEDVCAHETISDGECVTSVINRNFNTFDFDEACWTAYKNYSDAVENCNPKTMNPCYCHHSYYEMISFMQHVLKDKYEEISDDSSFFSDLELTTIRTFSVKIGEAEKDKIYRYIIQHYVKIILDLDLEEYSNSVMVEIRSKILVVLKVMRLFGKTIENVPDIVKKHMKLDFTHFQSELEKLEKLNKEPENEKVPIELSEKYLMRLLKDDAKSLIEKLPLVKENMDDKGYKIDRLLRKLRIYFADDIVKVYLDVYLELLLQPKLNLGDAEALVSGICMVASQNFCSNFLLKYVPIDGKINHKCIDRNNFNIQVAVCRNACYARSSQLQSNAVLYIKGDYVKYCTPMLPSYLANLRTSECIQLMQSVLDARLPKYKYTLRLALQCFTDCMASKLLLDMWENAKDASMRTFLYITVCNKIRAGDASSQIKFLEVLTTFTLDLNIADEKAIFDIMISDTLPECVMNEYLQVVWKQVNDMSVDVLYHDSVIKCIDKHVTKMDKEFVMSIVNDHVKNMFDEGGIISTMDDQNELIESKWDLTANFIVSITSDSELERISPLVKIIFQKCLAMWNDINDGKQTYKDFGLYFIEKLVNKSFTHDVQCFKYVDDIFNTIFREFQAVLPFSEIYKFSYQFKLYTLCRNVLTNTKLKLDVRYDDEAVEAILKDLPVEFALGLGKLVQELEDKGLSLRKIRNCILEKIERIFSYYTGYYFQYKYEINDMNIMAAVGLMQIGSDCTYLLAAAILREAYHGFKCGLEYSDAINILTEMGDAIRYDIKPVNCFSSIGI